MSKSAIFITDDIDNNEKITHMFTAEHGFIPGNITVHDQIHRLDFTTKPDEPSFFAFNIADNCDTNIVDVEACIGKEYASPYDMVYKGKKAYYFVSGENPLPVQYILADIEHNVIKMENNGGLTIFLRPTYIQSDQPYADVMRRDRGQNQPNPGALSQPNSSGDLRSPSELVIGRPSALRPNSSDDGSSVNTLSAPVQPESISTPVAIPIDEPHEIQTVLATAIQIAEPIHNV